MFWKLSSHSAVHFWKRISPIAEWEYFENISVQWKRAWVLKTQQSLSSPFLKTHRSKADTVVFWKLISPILKTLQFKRRVGVFLKLISPFLKTHQSNSRVEVFWKLSSHSAVHFWKRVSPILRTHQSNGRVLLFRLAFCCFVSRYAFSTPVMPFPLVFCRFDSHFSI